MIAVVTLLVAFPAGYFFGSRLAANTTYAVAYLWAFVFQTLYLVLDALERDVVESRLRHRRVPVGLRRW